MASRHEVETFLQGTCPGAQLVTTPIGDGSALVRVEAPNGWHFTGHRHELHLSVLPVAGRPEYWDGAIVTIARSTPLIACGEDCDYWDDEDE